MTDPTPEQKREMIARFPQLYELTLVAYLKRHGAVIHRDPDKRCEICCQLDRFKDDANEQEAEVLAAAIRDELLLRGWMSLKEMMV